MPRVEQLGDLGDLGRVHASQNSGTRATMLQVTTNWWRLDFLAEAGGDDGDGKREHAEPEQHDDAAEHLAQGVIGTMSP